MVSTNLTGAYSSNTLSGSVVLLRGLARQAAHWGDVPARLAEQLQLPVYTPDLPGMGNASALTPSRSLAEQAQQLLPQLQGAAAPWHLVGMSLGGMLALELARQYPDAVQSVVIINSSVATLSPFYQRLQWPMYPHVLRCLAASAAQRELLILTMTSNQPSPHPALALWQELARQQPVLRCHALRQLWAASHYRLDEAPSCAGLVISSASDRLVSPRCSDALAQFLGWPARQHPTAGHDIALDDADWLLRQLTDFYSSLSSKCR